MSSPSSCASLSMCYVNEAATDDDDDDYNDDIDDVGCYHKELCGSGPLGSPDLIAGMRRVPPQLSVSSSNEHRHISSAAVQPSTSLHHKELDQETRVCLYYWYVIVGNSCQVQ